MEETTGMVEKKVVTGDSKRLDALLNHPKTIAAVTKRLPASMNAERFLNTTLTLVQANPELLRCAPASIITGVYQAAELGLELSGVLGQAYLVPRWSKKHGCKMASFQVGYRGFPVLAFRSGKVRCYRPETVFANDPFKMSLGTQPRIDHTPAQGPRGEPIGYYAICQFENFGCDFEHMTHEEMVAHRFKYADAKSPAWESSFEKMAHKTVMRGLGMRLPVAIQLQEASVMDSYHEQGLFPEQGSTEPTPDMDADLMEMLEHGDPGDGPRQRQPERTPTRTPPEEEYQGDPEPDLPG